MRVRSYTLKRDTSPQSAGEALGPMSLRREVVEELCRHYTRILGPTPPLTVARWYKFPLADLERVRGKWRALVARADSATPKGGKLL